jgi:hypothetical protein
MATAELSPDLLIETDYETWLANVHIALTTMNMEMDVWQQNWNYDFLKEYEAGMAPGDAADHAHDFWWQHVLDECWT